jgi:hypothetical protein
LPKRAYHMCLLRLMKDESFVFDQRRPLTVTLRRELWGEFK